MLVTVISYLDVEVFRRPEHEAAILVPVALIFWKQLVDRLIKSIFMSLGIYILTIPFCGIS